MVAADSSQLPAGSVKASSNKEKTMYKLNIVEKIDASNALFYHFDILQEEWGLTYLTELHLEVLLG